MGKKASRRFNRCAVGFPRDAMERMEHCKDIGELAKEFGVRWGALYLWVVFEKLDIQAVQAACRPNVEVL